MIKHGDLKALSQGQLNDGLHFGTEGYKLLSDLLVRKLLIN